MEFDYVIVGAGSAGSILADRLSASGKHSVIVLEAGPTDYKSPYIHFPAGFFKLLDNPAVNWVYYTEPETQTKDRRILYQVPILYVWNDLVTAGALNGHSADAPA